MSLIFRFLPILSNKLGGDDLKYYLKEVRDEKGLSLNELARISGVAKRTICLIESGDANPLVSTMCKLAKALGVQAHELYSCE